MRKQKRVSPTAHAHRTQDALCSRLAQIEPVSSQPTRNRHFWRVHTDNNYDIYDNHTVVVLYLVTISFFLHYPLYMGYSTSAQNGYVIIHLQ